MAKMLELLFPFRDYFHIAKGKALAISIAISIILALILTIVRQKGASGEIINSIQAALVIFSLIFGLGYVMYITYAARTDLDYGFGQVFLSSLVVLILVSFAVFCVNYVSGGKGPDSALIYLYFFSSLLVSAVFSGLFKLLQWLPW